MRPLPQPSPSSFAHAPAAPSPASRRSANIGEHSRRLASRGAVAFAIGAASACAFQPVASWPLMPLAFALLLALLHRAPGLGAALAIGWAFGLGQFTVGLNWIATAFTYQAAMPAWLGWIAVVLLSLYLAVYPMLAAGLAWRLGAGRPAALVAALAGAWIVGEWLRAGIFTGFAWNPVGTVLVDTPLLPASALIGTYGLSGLVVLIGGALWLLVRRDGRPAAVIAAAVLLLALAATGRDPSPAAQSGRIRIVQPNIGQQDKWRDGFAEETRRRLAWLSAQGGRSGPLLLFWPEAALTEPLADSRGGLHRAAADLERRRAAAMLGGRDLLLTGGIALSASDGRTVDGAANSVFVIAPDGRTLGRYDKAHLVPYGEYLPMRPLLSAIGLSRLAPGDLDFLAGPGPRTLDLGQRWPRVGVQLCYEIIFSGEVVDRTDRPGFLFNPSNDAWFGRWGPPQHLAQARLRAAEEGIPVIRSTPTGISALIDARGKLVASLPWRRPGVINALLPPAVAGLTPFARLGNWLPLLLAAALLISGIVLARKPG